MILSIINTSNLKNIANELLLPNNKMKLLPAKDYAKYKWEELRAFCHEYARYGVPTLELVNYIKDIIGDRKAIEIGSGAGDLGYHLGIKMTDSKQQELPPVKLHYESMMQPVIKYPHDVEKIEALDAVYKYKPRVVVASWITPYSKHEVSYGSNPLGIKEDKILSLVETFIIVGNLDVHWDKPIRTYEHKTVHAPWIISRAKNPEKNCIFIWDKKENLNDD